MKRAIAAHALLFVAGCASASGASGPDGTRPVASVLVPFATNLETGALVTFDATQSYDPDNAAPTAPHGIAEFLWTLDSSPGESSATLAATGGVAELRVDAVGDFAGSLVVVDADGLTSDPAPIGASVSSVAAPLVATLTWNLDVVDFDIHLVNVSAGGAFHVAPFDCFNQSQSPDWGEPGALNDPELSGDVVDGFGPESISIESDTETATYRVMAQYFSDDGLGASTATIVVKSHGTTIVDASREISNGKVWDIATITATSGGAVASAVMIDTLGNP